MPPSTCSTLSIPFFSILDEETIFRSWDGDILKINTHNNETELLLKNTTFVSASSSLSYNIRHSSVEFRSFDWFPLEFCKADASINKMTPVLNNYFKQYCIKMSVFVVVFKIMFLLLCLVYKITVSIIFCFLSVMPHCYNNNQLCPGASFLTLQWSTKVSHWSQFVRILLGLH